MSKSILLSVSLLFLVLFNGCLARTQQQQEKLGANQNECQFDKLQALEPDNRIQCEAGVIESWNHNNKQFQCAGVALSRHTIERNGLSLPSFSNAPELVYIVEGSGIGGMIMPGCPETYESGQQSQQGKRTGQGYQDLHQRIQRFKKGDVLAFPAGVAHWCYNDGDSRLVAVVLRDTSNVANQLDYNPRNFFLAGNPQQEHEQQSEQGGEQQREQGGGGRRGKKGSSSSCNNIFCGFDEETLARAFNVDRQTARKLKNDNDNRNNIVNVEGGLDVVKPPRSRRGEQEQEQEQQGQGQQGQEQQGQEQEQHGHNGQPGGPRNTQTLCNLKNRENIARSSRADVYTPQAGRLSTLTSQKLPILNWLKLGAEYGVLYSNAAIVPHWNVQSHNLIYVTEGQAQIQIVNENGDTILNENVQKGQVVLVPQNHAVAKQAGSEGVQWIGFRTDDNAMINTLAGRTSAIRAMPIEVLTNAYQISREQAQKLKYNRQETIIYRPESHAQPGIGYA